MKCDEMIWKCDGVIKKVMKQYEKCAVPEGMHQPNVGGGFARELTLNVT
jgi:hypothetical protein